MGLLCLSTLILSSFRWILGKQVSECPQKLDLSYVILKGKDRGEEQVVVLKHSEFMG